MQIKQYGTLAAIGQKSFNDKEGITVEYNEIYIQTEDEHGVLDVSVVNSKQDLTKDIGQHGDFTLEVDLKNKRAKLISFTPAN